MLMLVCRWRRSGGQTIADWSLAAHVSRLTARRCCSLRRIKSSRRALGRSASVILINSLIVTRLDHYNSPVASPRLVFLLLYASLAWWGFATTTDRQRIEAFVRRGVRLGLYGSSEPTPTQLAEDADKRLFESIKYSEHHILPEHNSHSYSLRPRRQNFILTTKTNDRNFVTRQLFTSIYWTLLHSCFTFVVLS